MQSDKNHGADSSYPAGFCYKLETAVERGLFAEIHLGTILRAIDGKYLVELSDILLDASRRFPENCKDRKILDQLVLDCCRIDTEMTRGRQSEV